MLLYSEYASTDFETIIYSEKFSVYLPKIHQKENNKRSFCDIKRRGVNYTIFSLDKISSLLFELSNTFNYRTLRMSDITHPISLGKKEINCKIYSHTKNTFLKSNLKVCSCIFILYRFFLWSDVIFVGPMVNINNNNAYVNFQQT